MLPSIKEDETAEFSKFTPKLRKKNLDSSCNVLFRFT